MYDAYISDARRVITSDWTEREAAVEFEMKDCLNIRFL